MITMTKAQVAEALFVSDLQPSPTPSPDTIREAMERTIQRYGPVGCAARMASEFGDHPELAIRRMVWVRRVMNAASL